MRAGARLAVAVAVAVAVAAGGTVMERELGASVPPAAPPPEREVSGAWLCPHGGGEAWRAWVAVANPGTGTARLRFTGLGAGAGPATEAALEPGTQRHFEVAANVPGSGTMVEFFGSHVVAGMVTAAAGDGGTAAAPCADHAASRWFVPEGSTLRGEESLVVAMNPFSVEAVVDVVLFAGDRLIRPGRFQGVVVGPGKARAFRLNRFALGERALAASVSAGLGRVAVAGFGIGKGALRGVLGVPEPAARWTLPAAGNVPPGQLMVLAPGAAPVAVSARAHGRQDPVPLIDLESVSASTARAFDVAEAEAVVDVRSDRSPMVAGLRLAPAPPRAEEDEPPRPARPGRRGRRPRRPPPPPPPTDRAATEGAPLTQRGWVVPSAAGPDGGPAALVIDNPGEEEVEVEVRLLSAEGPLEDPRRLTVAVGTAARVELPSEPVAAVVWAGRAVVAAQVVLPPAGFAVALGSPIR